jgi:hypothetical protein
MNIYVMTSVFFQISPNDFLEASRSYNKYNEFALRIVSIYRDGIINFVYLPEVNLNELSLLATIFKSKLLPGIHNLNDLKNNLYNRTYYY